MKPIWKRLIRASLIACALSATPVKAQDIDLAWLQGKAQEMVEALKKQDRTALDALLQQTLEATAGTDLEMATLLIG